MICRKCKEYFQSGDSYVRYAFRHTAHWNCFFDGLTNAEAALKSRGMAETDAERSEKHARLIAAAPELYAACLRIIRETTEDMPPTLSAVEQCRRAAEKAGDDI